MRKKGRYRKKLQAVQLQAAAGIAEGRNLWGTKLNYGFQKLKNLSRA